MRGAALLNDTSVMAGLVKQGVTMKCSKRWVVCLWLCAAACRPAAAAEFRLAGGLWDYEVSGYQDDGGNITDLEDFAPGRQRDGFLQLEYEHRPSWIPDFALGYVQVSGEGSETMSGVGGSLPLPLPLPIPDPTASSSSASGEFRDVDFTLRYAFGLGPIRVAPGLTVAWISGDITTSTTDASGTVETRSEYDNVIPMLHGQVTWPIGDRVRLTADGGWIAANDNQVWQYGAAVEVRLLGPLGIYGGWHQRRYKVSSDESFLDASLRGWRYGLLIVF
jgi:hypothetical protein